MTIARDRSAAAGRTIGAVRRIAPALILLLALAGCNRVAPIRTLPAWVRGVYVPMIHNESYESSIEEDATKFTQEAFLADGRVGIVPKHDADLTVKVDIVSWNDRVTGTAGDHIGDRKETTLVATVKLFDPSDDKVPMADLGTVRIPMTFDIDARSSLYQNEPDRKAAILRQLAQTVVSKTIEGFPAGLRGLPTGVSLPNITTDASQVHTNDVLKQRESEDR